MSVPVVDRARCPHNHPCPLVDICPVSAITQGPDGYPTVNATDCIGCGACTENCPRGAMRFTE